MCNQTHNLSWSGYTKSNLVNYDLVMDSNLADVEILT